MTQSPSASQAVNESALPIIRPLVIPVSPADDASLIGLIASATADNVLCHTSIITSEVGLNLSKPGLVGQHVEPLLNRLARKIGCNAEDLKHRVHPYTPQAAAESKNKSANWHWTVRWGSGSLYRHHLLLERRRIAPITLESSRHHRWQWLCALLPYCPVSLERLVDECGACGAALGWKRSRGIGRCESCRQTVAPSEAPALRNELAEDYRRFARLISPTPGEREEQLASLHEDLRALSPPSLVLFVTRIGWLLGERAADPWSFSPTSLDQPALAEAVSVGMATLPDWPKRLRSRIAAAMAGSVGDERTEMLRRIRKLADRYSPSDLAQLVRKALPEAFEITQRALSLDMPTMLSCDICKLTGIDAKDVRRLEEARVFDTIETRGGQRRHIQFSKAQVQDFAKHKKESERATRLAEALGLPRYAVEQLIGYGEVTLETHPAVLVLDHNVRLVTSTVDDLFSDLNQSARRERPPKNAVSLWNASRTVGGIMKNWGEVVHLLRRKRIRYWLVADEHRSRDRRSKYVRRVLVIPEEVIRALREPIDPHRMRNVPIATVMSQIDAAELLNIDPVQMKRVMDAGDLAFEKEGKAIWFKTADVLDLAKSYISSPELAHLLGGYGPMVTKMLYKRDDIRRGSAGWLRADVIDKYDSLKVGAEPVLRRWTGPGGNFDPSSRNRSRSGQRRALDT
ncbi:hypothetical protein E5673_14790 [Sphingomonas sp. PAMC26645]|uniref:hypothetical protein n=1 Tax=Sphingomonas sp. PAMC26645 TaxID=2565555 RepID=UPI00109DF0CB|nr:hypothetical protein [Sphingomonas sp. PAMC26645]QCB43336.1 hypothetical protein E5673_14790 [Sphingomonas sp. PAMC26645]